MFCVFVHKHARSQKKLKQIHPSASPLGFFSPLGGEDAVEDGALPAVARGLQDEHVLDDVEGEAVIGEGAQQLGLQEGRPLFLQHPFAAFVPLRTKNV